MHPGNKRLNFKTLETALFVRHLQFGSAGELRTLPGPHPCAVTCWDRSLTRRARSGCLSTRSSPALTAPIVTPVAMLQALRSRLRTSSTAGFPPRDTPTVAVRSLLPAFGYGVIRHSPQPPADAAGTRHAPRAARADEQARRPRRAAARFLPGPPVCRLQQ